MDYQEQGVQTELQPNTELRNQLAQLRTKTYQEMRPAIERRIRENPAPTEQELVIGAFVEGIEETGSHTIYRRRQSK